MWRSQLLILIVAAGALHVGVAQPAVAQSVESLVAGTRVRVWWTESLREIRGDFVSVSAESVTIRIPSPEGARDSTFLRRSVMRLDERIEVPRGRSARRLGLYTALGGALLGGAFAGVLNAGYGAKDEAAGEIATGALGGGVIGFGIGAALGAAFPGSYWRRVF